MARNRVVLQRISLFLGVITSLLIIGIAQAQPPAPFHGLPDSLATRPALESGPITLAAKKKVFPAFMQRVPKEDTPFDTVDACVQQEMAETGTPGASVTISHNGQVVYQKGYGVKRQDETDPVDPQTLFRIGSITKMMTAAAVMQQVELGKVNLMDPVTTYIPEFKVAPPWKASDIKVWNLLTHSSSFPDRLYYSDLDGPKTEAALSQWAGTQSDVQLFAPPGSFWNYSNPNFSLAGLVVERTSGIPYHHYMMHNIWDVSIMTSTMLMPDEALAYGNYTFGHFQDPVTGDLVKAAPDAYDNAWAAPAGYAFSTSGDLVKWAQLLMDGDRNVISAASTAQMQSKQIWTHYAPDAYYGYGIASDKFNGVDILYHDGSIPGWGAMLLWVPSRNFAISVLGNTSTVLLNSVFCATAVVLELEDTPPPNYSTDPQTWDRFTGTYNVLDYSIPQGVRYAGVVSLYSDTLTLTLSFTDPFSPTIPFARSLHQVLTDTFYIDANLDGLMDFDLTFIDDPQHPGQVKWARNRYFVGSKVLDINRIFMPRISK